jgi:hypothetical protein
MKQASAPKRRRVLLWAGVASAAGVALSLAGCASAFSLAPDHVTFSRDELQRAVARKFPFQKNLAPFADVVLSNPVVSLLPEQNRVAVQVDAHFGSVLLNQPVTGHFTLSGQLVYDVARNAIVLKTPAVDSVSFDGDAQIYSQQVGRAAGLLAADLLSDYPVYTFKPGQLQFAGMTYVPGAITVLDSGIRVGIAQQ